VVDVVGRWHAKVVQGYFEQVGRFALEVLEDRLDGAVVGVVEGLEADLVQGDCLVGGGQVAAQVGQGVLEGEHLEEEFLVEEAGVLDGREAEDLVDEGLGVGGADD